MALTVLRWMHTDKRGLVAAAEAGAARARNATWSDDEAGIADLRGLMMAVLCTCANAGAMPATLDQSTDTVSAIISPSKTQRNVEAQFCLLNGIVAMIARKQLSLEQLEQMGNTGKRATSFTVDGRPAGPPIDIANPIVIGLGAGIAIAVGIVGVAGVVAGAISWMHASDNELKAIELQTNLKAKEHVATLSASQGVIQDHLEREHAENRSIPWTQAELNFLQQLDQSTKDITGWQAPPMKSVPDMAKASDAAAQAMKDVGSGIKAGTETAGWALPAALAVVAAIWLLK